jgi:hypothetical protein
MYEFHGWFGLAESTEESDAGRLDALVDELRDRLAGLGWSTASARLEVLNGQPYLSLNGLVNRIRDEAADVDRLLGWVAGHLPGSYGLLYERADELPDPGSFRVRVLARGGLVERPDPFLSPTRPTIED